VISVAGKVAMVTGGGSGIGRAVVEALLAGGASVGVLELDPGKCRALAELASDLLVVRGDATLPEPSEQLCNQLLERWGRIDVALTFVGVFDLYLPLEGIPAGQFDAAFDELFSVNVKSALVTARAVASALRRSRGSLILTLSSSSFSPGRGGTLYVATKFALRGALLQLAHELAPEVRVNGIAPGGTVETDLRGPRSLGMDQQRLDQRPGRREELEARTPLQVALTPADHVGAYLWLASDQARGVTGEIIRSDGGLGVR
jgi:NAD(P)-dependent dehydrogenase (short-subunit alcohol dehydrogenase family)